MFKDKDDGQEPDFDRIFVQNIDLLLRIAVRITNDWESAEDVVQDAFGKLIEKRMQFPSDEDARFWLIRVVKNGAINWSKRKVREFKAYEHWWNAETTQAKTSANAALNGEEQNQNAGTDQSAEHELLMEESAQEVRAALMRLPEKLRIVLILKEYEGMNYKEIAKVLGITEGNVKVRAFRAREALFSLLNEGGSHVSR
ncbi:MAG: RNA polymerase sigma factor [Rectinema sp.]|uniref:RNA polymerase sigma-24 factor n=1 Tax=uncultured spirochete TaxID=156406 RepID=A0A3P3XUZ0_9SPIR|nr:RNA polymerase sigma-24 factor [uncultured spirochete]